MYKKLITLLILLLISSCSVQTQKNYIDNTIENEYSKYLILGETEENYLKKIKFDVQLVYAPFVNINKEKLREYLEKHMTPNCVNKLLEYNKEEEIQTGNTECEIKFIGYLYGEHQQDGIPRVIVSLRQKSKGEYWDINLEMKLNKDKLIYDILAY